MSWIKRCRKMKEETKPLQNKLVILNQIQTQSQMKIKEAIK
jgi:hypothetical protein